MIESDIKVMKNIEMGLCLRIVSSYTTLIDSLKYFIKA